MTTREDLLITADELATLLAEHPATVRILDVRWTLPQPDGRPLYEAGHIPGAVYVDLETQLAQHGAAADGRHPLPSHDQLQAAARAWGLNDGDQVVAYDGEGNYASARAWWLLRNAGFANVRLLDGALPAWTASGRSLATGPGEPPAPGNVTLGDGHLSTLTVDRAGRLPSTAGGLLFDVRAPERYRGDAEPIDPRAGHIPGAVNAPTGANLTADGHFLPTEELRARFERLGANTATQIGSYCGSGVTASHNTFALTLAGFEDAALYPGSWSQWSNHPELPVATGPTP